MISKRLTSVIIVTLILLTGCVSSNRPSSNVYNGDISPIIDPIFPAYKQIKTNYIQEVWFEDSSGSLSIKAWYQTTVSDIGDSILIRSDISKMIYNGRTYRSIKAPLISILELADIQGNVKKTDYETIGASELYPGKENKIATMIGMMQGLSNKPTILNKGPLTTGDFLFSQSVSNIRLVIDGYSYWENEKVLVTSINDENNSGYIGYYLICPKTFRILKAYIIRKTNGKTDSTISITRT